MKICRLRLRNESSRKRRLTVTWFAEWTLGSNREDQQIHVQTSRDDESGALLARQYWNGACARPVGFRGVEPEGFLLELRSRTVPGPRRLPVESRGARSCAAG